jgi:tetratricopeptide (TPR) repeat protein
MPSSPSITGASGVRFARQAIASGVDDPDTLWMAGYTVAYLAADHATALNAIGRALVLNANSAHARGAKGLVEAYLGDGDPAIESFTQAIRLSPLDPLRYHYKFGMALAHMSAGRYDDTVAWMDQALHEKPTFHAPSVSGRSSAGCAPRTGGTGCAAFATFNPT